MSQFHAPGLVDIVSGNNTVSFKQAGAGHRATVFAARPGYDLASGVGTVDAARFVRASWPAWPGTCRVPAQPSSQRWARRRA